MPRASYTQEERMGWKTWNILSYFYRNWPYIPHISMQTVTSSKMSAAAFCLNFNINLQIHSCQISD